jgi:DNA-binding IscR family transcriptional regulator
MLEVYEEEVLMRLYDNGLIAMRYCAIQKAANIIKWQELAKKYKIKKSFSNVVRKLATKGYVDEHGKSGDVISLTRLGVLYVKGKTSKN